MNKTLRTSLITILFIYCTLLCLLAEPPHIGIIYNNSQYANFLAASDDLWAYRKAVELSYGRVVVLSQTYDENTLNDHLNKIDGLIIPGGVDVNPKYYNEEKHPATYIDETGYDEFEIKIIKYCIENKIPILGICRGCQLINAYFGGSLWQDIPSQYKSDITIQHGAKDPQTNKITPAFHNVNLVKGTMFYDIIQKDTIRVNSAHHQGIKKVADGFKVIARSEDGFIEGVERSNPTFIIAVQFHPERLILEDPQFFSIFEKLLFQAAKHSK